MSLLGVLSVPASRRIVLDGDSIIAGGNANVPLNTAGIQLAQLLPQCVVANSAVSGAVSQNCPHSGWDSVTPLRNLIYCIAVGHNDLDGSTRGSTIHDRIATVVTTVKASGARFVVVQTIIAAAAFTGQTETDRLDCNTLIRADKCGADWVYDAAGIPFFQDPANYISGGQGDGTHPSSAGTLVLMQGLAAVLQAGPLNY